MSLFHKDPPPTEEQEKSKQVQDWEKSLAEAKAREIDDGSIPSEPTTARIAGQDRLGSDRVTPPVTEEGHTNHIVSPEVAVTTGPDGEVIAVQEVTEAEAAAAANKKNRKR